MNQPPTQLPPRTRSSLLNGRKIINMPQPKSPYHYLRLGPAIVVEEDFANKRGATAQIRSLNYCTHQAERVKLLHLVLRDHLPLLC